MSRGSSSSSSLVASGATAQDGTAAHDGLLWSVKPFDAVSPRELYATLRLRSEVFVVEQHCVFLDMDDQDQKCIMVMGYQRHEHANGGSTNDSTAGSAGTSTATTASASGSSPAADPQAVTDSRKLVATARLFAPRDSPYAGYACIGRVCTSPTARRSGCGRALLTRCVAECAARYRTVQY